MPHERHATKSFAVSPWPTTDAPNKLNSRRVQSSVPGRATRDDVAKSVGARRETDEQISWRWCSAADRCGDHGGGNRTPSVPSPTSDGRRRRRAPRWRHGRWRRHVPRWRPGRWPSPRMAPAMAAKNGAATDGGAAHGCTPTDAQSADCHETGAEAHCPPGAPRPVARPALQRPSAGPSGDQATARLRPGRRDATPPRVARPAKPDVPAAVSRPSQSPPSTPRARCRAPGRAAAPRATSAAVAPGQPEPHAATGACAR